MFIECPLKTLARLYGSVRVNENGCWIWQNGHTGKGYPELRIGHTVQYAHRVMYEITRDRIPWKKQIHHVCMTPSCINPDHLTPLEPWQNRALQAAGVRVWEGEPF